MEITANAVKELRERTGVGMMECKKALQEAGGDPGEAEKILRKRAWPRPPEADRAAGEGTIAAISRATGEAACCSSQLRDRLRGPHEDSRLCARTERLTLEAARRPLRLLDCRRRRKSVAQHVARARGAIGENIVVRRSCASTPRVRERCRLVHTGGRSACCGVAGGAGATVARLARDVDMHVRPPRQVGAART